MVDINGEKLDVVYPLAKIAKDPNYTELRFSLRSLARQDWVRNVFVMGLFKPAWLNSLAVHIPFDDQWSPIDYKDKNIIKKMLRAAVDKRVSDFFVANSDDQYWLKQIRPHEMMIPPRENPPQMDREKANSRINPYPWRNKWVKRQYLTVDYLKKNGKSAICFEGHVPYVIQKDLYLETMAQIPWEMGEGFLIVVYHGWNWNSISNGCRIEDRDGVLARIKKDMSLPEIEKQIESALFLNNRGDGLSPVMIEFLKNRFPEPSPWERK